MPTVHKPVTEYQSMDYGGELTRLEGEAEQLKPALGKCFKRWFDRELEEDDYEPIIVQLKRWLTFFALKCNALPHRTPRKLVATVKHIGKNPTDFLSDMDKYDPEATARVIAACAAMSPDNRKALLAFENGEGSGPSPEDVAKAALVVLEDLEALAKSRRRGGRPELELQSQLAVALGYLFVNAGGKISRIVFDQESGPFHEFLELVLPLVRAHARRAGFALNVNTMVAKARGAIVDR